MKDKTWRRYIVWFIFGVALITIYKTIDSFGIIFSWFGNLISLLAPFGLGMLLAYMLYFPCRKLEKTYKKIKIKFLAKKARVLSVATMYILIVIVVIFVVNIILPMLSESIMELAKSLPNYYNKAVEFLENQPEDSVLTKVDALSYVKKLEEVNLTESIVNLFDINNINKYIKGITSIAGLIFDVFVTLIISIYMLLERTDIKSFLKNFFKAICSKKGYYKISRYYNKTNSIFYKYISAQILDAIIIGIITSIAMSIMHVKYGLLLGFIIGLFNVIPYFGAIVAVGIAVLITVFTGGLANALWLALVIIILQQIDANIINPKILGDSLQISRILIIFSVTFFGAYFGVIGMFLGVPIVSLLKVFVFDFIDEKNREKVEELKE